MQDDVDDFLEYDFTMGADEVECPHCGKILASSLFIDGELECPHCGKKFKKKWTERRDEEET